MNFYKKPSNLYSFWVENYTPTEKKVFLSLGFHETKYSEVQKKFGFVNSSFKLI